MSKDRKDPVRTSHCYLGPLQLEPIPDLFSFEKSVVNFENLRESLFRELVRGMMLPPCLLGKEPKPVMSDDEQALLRAVLDHPHDDTPRLCLADWLDEHAGETECGTCAGTGVWIKATKDLSLRSATGRGCHPCSGTGRVGNGYAERSEFIRCQIRLASRDYRLIDTGQPGFSVRYVCGCGFEKVCEECIADSNRVEELLAVHQFAWFALPTNWQTALDEREADGRPLAVVSRGFVHKLICHSRDFTADLARAVFGCQPVTEVVLSDREPHESSFSDAWIWFRDSDTVSRMTEREYVPESLFNLLDGQSIPSNRPLAHKQYRTRDAALAALSTAAVAWARGLVGLPTRG